MTFNRDAKINGSTVRERGYNAGIVHDSGCFCHEFDGELSARDTFSGSVNP